jgi:WD repeat-containing protein 61
MFKQSRRIEGAHEEGIWSLDWRENNIFTGSLDGTIKLWSASIKPDGAAGENFEIIVKNVTETRRSGVTSIITTNKADIAISCFQDGFIKFLSASDLTEIGAIEAGLLEAWTLCISPDDEVIASGTGRGTINIWSCENKAKVTSLNTSGKFVLNSCFSPDGAKLVSSSMDGTIYFFDIATQQLIQKVEPHALPVRKINFSADGNLLFSASDDRHVSVFDIRSGIVINSFSHSGTIYVH